MLNRGKGPAVHSLRAQADRRLYQQYMKHVLELQDNLDLKQAMVTELLVTNGIVTGLQTQLGAYYEAKAIILATGTYLDSTTITGSCVISSGPDGMHLPLGCRIVSRPWACHAPVQDRDASTHQPAECGLLQNGASTGR